MVSLSLNRLLAELTTPLECLGMVGVATRSNQSSTATQQVVIYKLTQLLYNAKESFLDGGAMPAVLRHVHHTLEKVKIVTISIPPK